MSTFARLTPALCVVAWITLTPCTVQADDVTVQGVHLCCGACVNAVARALDNVDGVSRVHVNKDQKTVGFTAADAAAAKRGLQAMADAGFYGKPSVAGLEFDVGPDQTANEITISKIHLCCPSCTRSVDTALKPVDGVESVDVQAKAKTVTVKGKNINLSAVLNALHEAGFHGTVK